MRQKVDETLLREMREHALRFTCPDCLYRLADGTCAHGWPNADHRHPPDAATPAAGRQELVFCKEFDLR